MRALLTVLAAALSIGNAFAVDLTVRVTDGAGAGVENAIVTFTPTAAVTTPIRFDWPYQVAQQNLQFAPYILIVPVGATVRFPNLDRVRHHVYSFSEGSRFELELFGRDESRSHRFMQAGVAAVGCNIHDQMQAYIVIVDTPYVGRTDASGSVLISGASGAGALRVWHPDLRARGGAMNRAVTLPASGPAQQSFTVQLRAGGHAH
ncbi:MAG: methylamine utilization protein [Phycisphaerales bacterium]|nr:methylamine utilization protein [Hyphomonadaceae bacterium]